MGELASLTWQQFELDRAKPHVTRLKNGDPSVHPHIFRHATGYQLASAGTDTRAIQGYMGHKNIQHTVRYRQLNPDRFKDFGKLL